MTIDVHPVQRKNLLPREKAQIGTRVTLRAYEVYCHIYGAQPAMIEGSCRGGFGAGELICFLYAHSFPREEWRARVDEAFKGMVNL